MFHGGNLPLKEPKNEFNKKMTFIFSYPFLHYSRHHTKMNGNFSHCFPVVPTPTLSQEICMEGNVGDLDFDTLGHWWVSRKHRTQDLQNRRFFSQGFFDIFSLFSM
jgi:hypothetical protein